ncbi:MAG: hypothetical protein IK047_00625 [Clostridia bacterium]|nr:hypothetical protein [Clostridia bacterium]
MKDNEPKKAALRRCAFYALIAFAAISFLWVCFIALGIDNNNVIISAFARRLVLADLAIAAFSAVFGFSFMLFGSKKLSPQAQRGLHILVNYLAAMLCVFALVSNVKNVKLSGWAVFFVLASAVFFAVYGIAVLIVKLVNKKKS